MPRVLVLEELAERGRKDDDGRAGVAEVEQLEVAIELARAPAMIISTHGGSFYADVRRARRAGPPAARV